MSGRKKTIVTIIVLAVVALLVVVVLKKDTNSGMSVYAEHVAKRELVEIVSASGRVQPKTKVNITSEINGEIIALPVREGDRVRPGDLLVVLDTVQLQSDADQARFAVNEINARLAGAKSLLAQQQEEFDRQKRLYESNLTSETAFTDAKYAYANAEATYDATVAQARQYESRYEKQLDNLSKAKIVAPMPGVITYLDAEVGEIAAAQTAFTQGKTLMTISDLDVFEVEVEVDETEIAKIDLGQSVKIEVDAFPDTIFDGTVVEIGNTAIYSGTGTQDQSTNFKVKVVFNDRNAKIRPGMSATVDVTTSKVENALTIPFSAIVMRTYDLDSLELARSGEVANTGGIQAAEGDEDTTSQDPKDEKDRTELKGVFVIRDGKAVFVQVETGIADQKHIQVTSGLEDGEQVVSGPYRVLRTINDGEDVTVSEKPNMGTIS